MLKALYEWMTMPATRGEQFLTWLTILTLGTALLRQVGKLTRAVLHAIKRSLEFFDWFLPIITQYPDPNEIIRKLKKMNGHDKAKVAKEGEE